MKYEMRDEVEEAAKRLCMVKEHGVLPFCTLWQFFWVLLESLGPFWGPRISASAWPAVQSHSAACVLQARLGSRPFREDDMFGSL